MNSLKAAKISVSRGARALCEGGYQSLPRAEMPGALLIGDSAGLLNVPKIKGTPPGDEIWHARGRTSFPQSLTSEGFDQRLRASDIVAELKTVRNIRPGFHKGLWRGMTTAAIETRDRRQAPPDFPQPRRPRAVPAPG